MIRIIIGSFLASMVIATGCNPAPVSEPPKAAPETIDIPEAELKALAEGNNQFAIELYRKVAEGEQGNICISPYSVRTAMAMTYAGARGTTAEELKAGLHF